MRSPNHDIIMMALPRWDGPYSSTAFSLAKELSRHTRVFYIDNPITIKDYIVNRKQSHYKKRKNALFAGTDFFTVPDKDYPNLFAVTPRVTIPINWLPDGWVYNRLAQLNDLSLSRTLNHLIRIFAIRKYILVNSFNPLYGRFLNLSIQPLLKVYQCVDDMTQAPYMQKHGPRLENRMIADSDFTVVTSSELKRLKSVFSDQVYLLPNAANVNLFRTATQEELSVPEEIAKIPAGKKIITYTGNICQRLDYNLLKKIASAHRDKILLMIGPFSRKDYQTSGLSRTPNVIFTGRKKLEELPAYLKYSHCCIIPFLCNQLTRSIYPLKINEYLSAGKPVVTTDFSDDIRSFRDVAYIARNHDEFLTLINKAMNEESDLRKIERMIFSAANNWETRAHQFIDLTVEFLKHHDGGRGKPERRERAQVIYG